MATLLAFASLVGFAAAGAGVRPDHPQPSKTFLQCKFITGPHGIAPEAGSVIVIGFAMDGEHAS